MNIDKSHTTVQPSYRVTLITVAPGRDSCSCSWTLVNSSPPRSSSNVKLVFDETAHVDGNGCLQQSAEAQYGQQFTHPSSATRQPHPQATHDSPEMRTTIALLWMMLIGDARNRTVCTLLLVSTPSAAATCNVTRASPH